MVLVRSAWTNRPIVPTGMLSSPEWRDAGEMHIPGGLLLALNDWTDLYLGLDLSRYLWAGAQPKDYFWLSIDVGGDGRISAHRDVIYAPVSEGATGPCRIGRRLYRGPQKLTDFIKDEIPLLAGVGFAASPRSAEPHRLWELRIPLRDVGVDLGGAPEPAVIRFGLRTATGSPPVVLDYPPRFTADFSCLHEIHLAVRPP